MRKFGKYEKMRKNAILQTYITSLLCLVLCVAMFFGTSMAWFSDTAESTQNQMFVGTLTIDLNHASFKGGQLQLNSENKMNAVEGDYKIFESGKKTEKGIRWEPGYTAVEKFELIENGDLAFSYQMGIEHADLANAAAEQIAIAKAITVWNYQGNDAKEIGENEAKPLSKDFATMVSAGWKEVGTLYDVITNHKPVFEGNMDKSAVTATKTEGQGEQQKTVEDPAKAYHLIALHMDESFADTSVQGKTLDGITIKLVATQTSSEQDAFGSDYDGGYVFVSNETEFYKAIENGATKIMLAEGKYKLEINTNIKTLNENCDSLTITGQGASTKLEFANKQVVLNQFKNLTISNCAIEKMNDKGWGHLVFSASGKANGVYTVSNCIFNCNGDQGIYINESVDGATYNIVNCTFNGTFGHDAAITIQDNDAKFIVNVAGCEFNLTGESREIVAAPDGTNVDHGTWTLNVDGEQVAFEDVKKTTT